MRKTLLVISMIALMLAIPLLSWLVLYLRGKQFAIRDHLQKADAIVVLVGTRGNIDSLNGKICTAVHLYKQGWVPYILCSGKFSVKVTEEANLIPLHELQTAAINDRIQEQGVPKAAATWDMNLGAGYIRDRAIQMGVPATAFLVEDEALHTRENAEQILPILKQYNMRRIILVTSPFHQLRTYPTFVKVLQPHNITIINYYADTDEWHPTTWFLSPEHRKVVNSEIERIKIYRKKGDVL
jgi:uncharacterized SAM-binding protein YcdF (DUF218 family)